MTAAGPLRAWLAPARAATEGIEQDLFDGLAKVTGGIVVGTSFGAVLTVMVFPDHPNAQALKLWLAVFLLISLWRLLLRYRYQRDQLQGEEARRQCERSLQLIMLHSAMWGVLSILLWHPGNPVAETVLQVSVVTMSLGATIHLAPFYPVLRAYVLLATLPLLARDLAIGGLHHLILAMMLALITYYALYSGRVQFAMNRDVYAQRRRNAELAAALKIENAVAEAARRRAEEANAARTRLFAAANHDLRQPLHAIGLLAQTLQSPYGLENAAAVGARVVEGVDSLGHLVDELIELSRVDSGSLEPLSVPFDLHALLADTVALFEPAARTKGLRLVLAAPPGAALGDRALVGRVLSNLVSNAVRYTAEGKVTLRAWPLTGGVWEVTVEDTGIGISEAEQARIFDEFYQTGNPGRDRTLGVGLGLGLAIVKRLSDLLSLGIRVESVIGRGSRFAITLPAATAEQVCAAPLAPADDNALHGLRVLVVEDDALARAALVQLLGSWGCTVLEADGAEQAIAHGETPGGSLDCGLIDLRLTEGLASRDGLDVLLHLRQHLGTAWQAAIVTGDAGSARAQAVKQAGVAVLNKPVRPMQLRAFLGNVVAQRALG